jgi:hypothetical protein
MSKNMKKILLKLYLKNKYKGGFEKVFKMENLMRVKF